MNNARFVRTDMFGEKFAVCGIHLKSKELITCCKTCPICLDELNNPMKIIKLPCKHEYHFECLSKQLKHNMNNKCSLCRTEFDVEKLAAKHMKYIETKKYYKRPIC
jgi:hypothetical protein